MSFTDESHIVAALNAAHEGKRPHEILQLLLSEVEPRQPDHVPILEIEYCLIQAFNVPLRTVRNIEAWKGFSEYGDMTDQDVDTLLDPWIMSYLNPQK